MLETTEQYAFYQLLAKGGWVMWPLFFCSLIALAVIIDRLLHGPRRARVIPTEYLNDIYDLIGRGRLEEIVGLSRANKSPLARIILVAVQNANKPREQLKDAVELAGKSEVSELQKHTSILGTIAAISPLLGLLGTVLGMIKTFDVIKIAGVGQAASLSGGISEALITTATGLTIAIPTLVFYRFFLTRTRLLVVRMEQIAFDILNSLVTEEEEQVDESTPQVRNIQ